MTDTTGADDLDRVTSWLDAQETIGPLVNPRHEIFAQERAKGATLEQAYVAAGYKPDRGNPCRLTADDRIAGRILELRRRAALLADYDLAKLVEMQADAYKVARDERQPAAMTGAAREIGVLTGLRVEKRQEDRRIDVSPAADDLARALLAAIAPSMLDVTPQAKFPAVQPQHGPAIDAETLDD